MKITKRLLAFLLAWCMLFSSMPMQAFATETDGASIVETDLVDEPIVEDPVVEEPPAEDPIDEEPPVEEPIDEEPPVEDPIDEEPPVEEPIDEEPPVEDPIDEEPPVEDPIDEEPPVEDPIEEETPEEDPIEEEPVEDEVLVNGYIGINWSNASHSGYVPNVAEDLRVLDAAGNETDAKVSESEGTYAISGLKEGQSYSVRLIPGENSGYSVTGENTRTLVYNGENNLFAAEAFTAELDTYTLLYNVVWPEDADVPEDFQVSVCLNGMALDLQQAAVENGVMVDGLFEADGDYTLVLPEVDGYRTEAYEVDVNAATAQPLELVYEREARSAEFTVFWSDDENRSGRRTEVPMEDLVNLYDGNGARIEGFSISGEEVESSFIDGYARYDYVISNLDFQGNSFVLEWKNTALPGYESLDSYVLYEGTDHEVDVPLVDSFEDQTFYAEADEDVLTAGEDYAFFLSKYAVKLNPTGLDEAALQEYMDGIRVTRMDVLEGGEVDYNGFKVVQNADEICIDFLYTTYVEYDEALPAIYTVYWPAQIGEFYLDDPQMNSAMVGAVGFGMLNAAAGNGGAVVIESNYHEKVTTYTASTQNDTSLRSVYWYDTNNDYNHGGKLNFTLPVTASFGNPTVTKTINVSFGEDDWENLGTTEEPDYAYVHDWTEAELKELLAGSSFTDADITGFLTALAQKPLIVRDTGENNINRILQAIVPEGLTKTETQYLESTNTEVALSVASANITGNSYPAPTGNETNEIVTYVMGKDNNVTVMYAMTWVDFYTEVRDGDWGTANPQSAAQAIQNWDGIKNSLKLWLQGDPQNSESGVNTPLAAEANYFINKMGMSAADVAAYITANYKFDLDATKQEGHLRILLPLFDTAKTQITYAIKANQTQITTGNTNGDYYRVEYTNVDVHGMSSQVAQAYEDGTAIFILTNQTNFTFHKVWEDELVDGTNNEKFRPNATYSLWRYTMKGDGSFENAAPVYDETSQANPKPQITGSIGSMDKWTLSPAIPNLPKYDAEGYRYVYLIRETMTDNKDEATGKTAYANAYTSSFAAYLQDGTLKKSGDVLPDGVTTRESNDNSVYNTGVIVNSKADKKNMTVTKTWVAARYQDYLDEMTVELKLYARPQGSTSEDAWTVVATETINGFDKFNPSKTVTVENVPALTANGIPYEYKWVETSVKQGTTSVTPDAATGDYTLPVNTATMTAESYSSDSSENFHVDVTAVDSNGHATVTNKLEGVTEYWVKKTWDTSIDAEDRTDVTFDLYQIQVDGPITPYTGNPNSYELDIQGDQYATKTNGYGNCDSNWVKAFVNLPKYDAYGNELTYIVKETNSGNFHSVHQYGHNVDTDTPIESNSLIVHNGPNPSRYINLRKVWLDDSATTARQKVYFNVQMSAEPQKYLYAGTAKGNGSDDGGLLGKAVEITDETDWRQSVDVTIYYKTENGETSYIDYNAFKQLTAAEQETWTLYTGGFAVTEAQMGTNAVDTQNKTAAGYSTVMNTADQTSYVVIYHNADGSYNPTASTQPMQVQSNTTTRAADSTEEFYTVSNLRYGTVTMQVEKTWNDDGPSYREGFDTTVQVRCDTKPTYVANREGLGYARVSKAIVTPVNSENYGWQPIYKTQPVAGADTPAQQTSITQTVGGTQAELTIYYYNLPLYDETGKLLEYSVVEDIDKKDTNTVNGTYVSSSSGVSYADGSNAMKVTAVQNIENTYSGTTDVQFHLLWLDQYRVVHTKSRPDMYLTLYKEVDGVVSPYSYTPYNWTPNLNKGDTRDHWTYTFKGLPEFDPETGKKITYFATISSQADAALQDYVLPQYAEGAQVYANNYESALKSTLTIDGSGTDATYNVGYTEVTNVVGKYSGDGKNVYLLQENNTFVMQIKDDIHVRGRKVWERIPDGFPVEDLPLLNFTLLRSTQTEATPQDGSTGGTTGGGNEVVKKTDIPVAFIVDHISPSLNYEFYMNHYGILNAQGEPIDDDAVIKRQNGDEIVAKDLYEQLLWEALEDSDYSNANKEQIVQYMLKVYAEGQPLPQYDEFGAIYTYTIIEAAIVHKNADGSTNNHIKFEMNISSNEYAIKNTFHTSRAALDVSKTFNGLDRTKYPALTFELYRYFQIDHEWVKQNDGTMVWTAVNKLSEPTPIATISLTSAEVEQLIKAATPTVTNGQQVYVLNNTLANTVFGANTNKLKFEDLHIYAPNGNPYYYYVNEIDIDGYDTAFTVTGGDGFGGTIANKTGTDNTITSHFTLIPSSNTAVNFPTVEQANQKDPTLVHANVSYTNTYEAETKSFEGGKNWTDYEDKFGTRPNSLPVVLMRKANGMGDAEKVADIILRKGTDNAGTATMTLAQGFAATENSDGKNVYGTITLVGEDSKNWNVKIVGLDKYASNGEEWNYYLEENISAGHYVESGSGTAMLNNKLTGNLELFKYWVDENGNVLKEEGNLLVKDEESIAYDFDLPPVTLTLQVLVTEGNSQYTTNPNAEPGQWMNAIDYFGTSMIPGETYTRVLAHEHWRDIIQNLPVSYGCQAGENGSFTNTKFQYRIVETAVDGKTPNKEKFEIKYSYGDGAFAEDNSGAVLNTNNKVKFKVQNGPPLTSLTVTKTWTNDHNNAYTTRDNNKADDEWKVHFHVFRSEDGNYDYTSDELVVKSDGTALVLAVSGEDSADEATVTYDNLPAASSDGDPYYYYAMEINRNSDGTYPGDLEDPETIVTYAGENGERYYGAYNVDVQYYDMATFDEPSSIVSFHTSYTNDLVLTQLDVAKTWEGDIKEGYNLNFRPSDLELTLWQSAGEEDPVSITTIFNGVDASDDENVNFIWSEDEDDENIWTASFQQLPMYNNKGQKYIYTVTETYQQTGYQAPYKEDIMLLDGQNQITHLTNVATKFRMEKYGFDTAINTDVLYPVKLVFRSVEKLTNTKTSTVNENREFTYDTDYFWLFWEKTANGESFKIIYNDSQNASSVTDSVWSSGSVTGENAKVDIIGLPAGTYRLVAEPVIPDGYWPSALTREFTLGNDGIISEPTTGKLDMAGTTLKVANSKTTFSLVKTGNGTAIPAAESADDPNYWVFNIKGMFRQENGTFAEETISYNSLTDPATLTGNMLADSVYEMWEVENPDGFKLDTRHIYFKLYNGNYNDTNDIVLVNADGNTTTYTNVSHEEDVLTFNDDPFQINVTKLATDKPNNLDITTKFTLYAQGETGSWTAMEEYSTNSEGSLTINSMESVDPYSVIFKTGGTYKIAETTAPAGYILPDNHPYVVFTFDNQGVAAVGENNLNIVQNTKSNAYTFTDAPIELTLTKYDLGDAYQEKTHLEGVAFDVYAVKADGTKGNKLGRTAYTTLIQSENKATIHIKLSMIQNNKVVFPVGGTSYILSEVAKTGYHTLPDFKIKVETNGTVTLETYAGSKNVAVNSDNKNLDVGNDRKLGTLILTKKGDGKYTLRDVEFQLLRTNEPETWWEKLKTYFTGNTYTIVWDSDNDGRYEGANDVTVGPGVHRDDDKLVIENLPWGTYTLKEVAAKDGFKLSNETYTFTFDDENNSENVNVSEMNSSYTYENASFFITFNKRDATNGEGLPGGTFTLTGPGLPAAGIDYHAEDGVITIYSIEDNTETANTNDYITILKTSANATNPENIYTLTETVAPAGYELPADGTEIIKFWVNTDGVKQVVENDNHEFLDTPIELKLVKYDNGDALTEADKLSGISFILEKKNGTTWESVGVAKKTDSNGEIVFGIHQGTPLIYGNDYRLRELDEQDKEGYSTTSFEFSINTNGTIVQGTNWPALVQLTENTITMVSTNVGNNRETGSVQLTKSGTGSNFLDHAEFNLEVFVGGDYVPMNSEPLVTGKTYTSSWTNNGGYDNNGKAIGVSATFTEGNGTTGILEITGLPWGDYKLVETKAPDGYALPVQMNAREVSFTIHPDGTADNNQLYAAVTKSNSPFDMTFTKNVFQDEDDAGAVLPGAQFKLEVQGANNSWSPVAVSGENITVNTDGTFSATTGTVTLNSLNTNPVLKTSDGESKTVYKLTETKAPAGYELHNPAPYIEFYFDETGVQKIHKDNNVDLRHDVTADFEFLDKAIELSLVKYDSGDTFNSRVPLAGVTFTLKKGTEEIGTYTTNGDGEISFTHVTRNNVIVFPVAEQTYTLTESQKTGYEQVADISFTVNADGTITLNDAPEGVALNAQDATQIIVDNTRVLGTVVLNKDAADGDYPLNEAEFKLLRKVSNGTFMDWILGFITGNTYGGEYAVIWTEGNLQSVDAEQYKLKVEKTNGRLLIKDLPWGEYRLVETKAPDGFVLPATPIEHYFEIDADNLNATLETDPVPNNSFSLSFTKHELIGNAITNNKLLPGAEYKLYEDEKLLATYTDKNGDGRITLNSVEDTTAASAAASEVQINTVNVKNDVNTKLYSVMRYDVTYRLVETKAPDAYKLPNNGAAYAEFKVSDTGNVTISGSEKFFSAESNVYKFYNEPIKLTLNKRDGGDRSAAETFLAGVTFEILNASGRSFANLPEGSTALVVTGADGSLELPVIRDASGAVLFPIGGETYQLMETQKNGYEQLNNIQFTVDFDGTVKNVQFVGENAKGSVVGSGETITVTNQRILGTVELKKTDLDERPLNDIHFKLYRENVSESLLDKIKDFVTGKTYTLEAEFTWADPSDENIHVEDGPVGLLTIKDLDWGNYKLVETYADGYVLDTEDESSRTYTFKIGPDDPDAKIFLNVKLDVTNRPNRVIVHKVAEGKNDLLAGAQYDLYYVGKDRLMKIGAANAADTSPKPVWNWNSATGTGEALRLNMGTYRLVETRSPFGYVISHPMERPIEFTIDQDGEVVVTKGDCRLDVTTEDDVSVPVIKAEDKQTLFKFTKVELYNEYCHEDADATRILPGVEFTAYEDAGLTKKITTAVSDDNGVVTFVGLPLKDYKGDGTKTPVYIKETATVAGHVLDENVYKVYVDSTVNSRGVVTSNSVLLNADDSAVTNNTVINDVFRADFSFTKVSELDNLKVIPGGEYALYRIVHISEGPVELDVPILVAKAISDENGLVVFEGLLMDTVYTVKELSVPTGSYVSKNGISFRYTWNNGAQLTILDDGEDTITASENGLLWQEPQVVVSILKVSTSKKPLKGATLQIRDKNGNVIPVLNSEGKKVNSWVSTKEAFIVGGILEAGETYWLHELKAPSGFVKARAVKFSIPDDALKPGANYVVKVQMINHRIEESPKTGDDIMLAGSVMTFSAAALFVLLMMKKKRR